MSAFMTCFLILGIAGGIVFLLAGILDWASVFDSGFPKWTKVLFGDKGGRVVTSALGGCVSLGLVYVLLASL